MIFLAGLAMTYFLTAFFTIAFEIVGISFGELVIF